MYREARYARIYDGPDEVHRDSVARRILANPDAVPWMTSLHVVELRPVPIRAGDLVDDLGRRTHLQRRPVRRNAGSCSATVVSGRGTSSACVRLKPASASHAERLLDAGVALAPSSSARGRARGGRRSRGCRAPPYSARQRAAGLERGARGGGRARRGRPPSGRSRWRRSRRPARRAAAARRSART